MQDIYNYTPETNHVSVSQLNFGTYAVISLLYFYISSSRSAKYGCLNYYYYYYAGSLYI